MTTQHYRFSVSSYLLPILFFGVLFLEDVKAQRDVIWIGGLLPGQSIFGGSSISFAADYNMNNLLTGTNYFPEQGVDAAVAALAPLVNEGSNVLGVAHDYSGIILRKLQLENPNISAMILNGVPNKGSNVIWKAIDNNGNPANITPMEDLINEINSIKQGDNCEDCNVVGLFALMMQNIENLREPLLYVTPINGQVNSIGAPTVPTVVLWGDHEQGDTEAFLTSLMSAKGDPLPVTEADLIGDCVRNRRLQARSQAKFAFELATFRATTNFFADVLKAAGDLVSGTSPGTIIGSLSSYISAQSSLISEEIEAVRTHNDELARLLRCELANQVLATRYALMITNGALASNSTEIPDPEELLGCLMECEELNYEMNTNVNCDLYCDPGQLPLITVPTFSIAPNDGLYSKEEQLLDGATVTIRLAGVNHFDEPKYFHPTVRQVYEDLFNGNSGPAFTIPPQ